MKNIIILISLISTLITLRAQDVVVSPMEINTNRDDFSTALTLRNNKMYITSERGSEQNIYRVKRVNGEWNIEEEVDGDVNSGSQNGSVTLTPDGQYMIFASYENDIDGFGRTDLYSARRVDGEWEDIQNLGVAVNSEYWDSQPSLSADGNTLYFASDRPGQGGSDIYYSTRTREGWTKAKQVRNVNTDRDDMSPFISYDNKTFTFSSNRDGNFDIFFAKISNESASNIRKPNSPINTDYDEYFYTVIANTDNAYFASSRPGGKGGLDIYSAVPNPHKSDDVVFVHGIVSDKISGDPLGSNIIITNIGTGEEVANLHSDDITGEYSVVLQPGNNYSITAEKEGYLFYSENFNIPATITSNDIEKNIELSPIQNGKTRLLIFFDFDKSNLKDESIPELDRIVRFLNSHPEVNIALHGHTDNVGEDAYNMKLSENRAKSVYNYLIDKGITKNRLGYKGFGKNNPITENNTDAGRAMNRRVEMVITKS